LLREHRGLGRISPKVTSIDRRCKELLLRLLDVLESCGEKVPVLVTDVCRSIHNVRNGTLGIRDWRRRQESLDRFRV
jgi:hypothetical protein